MYGNMVNKKNFSLSFLLFGVIADMITTVIGQFKGFEEGNMLGFHGVYALNTFLLFCIIFALLFTDKKRYNIYITTLFILLGLFRLGIAIYNISLF